MEGKAILAMMVAVGCLGSAALAQQSPDGSGKGQRPHDRMTEYLGLSAEQRDSMRALRKEHQKETEPLRAEGRELHEKLRSLLDQDNPDPSAVGTAMLAVKQHETKMKASHEAFEGKLKAQLTPQQQQKFDALKAARETTGPRHGGPGGFRGRPPMPPDGGEPPVQFER
jgi:Spy/CpxP family protein refolding chaperone